MFNKIISRFKNEDKIKELNNQINYLNNAIQEKDKEIKKLKDDKNFKTTEEQKAEYWNNKWNKTELTYPAREDNIKLRYDLRNFVYSKSHIIENSDIIKELKNSNLEDDKKVLEVLRWAGRNLKYIGDFKNQKLEEYWQDPEFTLQTLKGDCEDGSLLIISMLRILKIPSYRIKVYCGWVSDPNNLKKKVGHAFCIYLADDDKWYILDWCYFLGESIVNFKKLEHKQNDKYKEVWWSFNDEFSWK